MRTVLARGRAAMAVRVCSSGAVGSNLNSIVGRPATERPFVVVAANLRLRSCASGMRKVPVQPAPRMRRSSSVIVRGCFGDVVWRRREVGREREGNLRKYLVVVDEVRMMKRKCAILVMQGATHASAPREYNQLSSRCHGVLKHLFAGMVLVQRRGRTQPQNRKYRT